MSWSGVDLREDDLKERMNSRPPEAPGVVVRENEAEARERVRRRRLVFEELRRRYKESRG